jgi:hypothetical protein
MRATLEYDLPEDQEAYYAALYGIHYQNVLGGLIIRLSKLAYPDKPNQAENKPLLCVLQQLEQQMERLGLNRSTNFTGRDESDG